MSGIDDTDDDRMRRSQSLVQLGVPLSSQQIIAKESQLRRNRNLALFVVTNLVIGIVAALLHSHALAEASVLFDFS